MATGILISAGVFLLYAAYKYKKLLDRISDLETQVKELKLWKDGREAENREIEKQVSEDMQSAESLSALLDEGLRGLKS